MGGAADRIEEQGGSKYSPEMQEYHWDRLRNNTTSGYGYHGYSEQDMLDWAIANNRGGARKGSKVSDFNPEWYGKIGWSKRRAEDPAYNAQVKKAQSGNFLRQLGGAVKTMGSAAGDAAKGIAPSAALMGGLIYTGGALNGAWGPGATTATTGGGNALATDALTMNAPMGGPLGANVIPGVGTVAGSTYPALVTNTDMGVTDSLTMNSPTGGALTDAITTGGTKVANGLTDNLDNWLIGGSSLASGLLSHNATEKGIDEIARQYDQTRADMEPWRQAGVNALGTYGDRLNQPVDKFEFNLEDDPIYQFQLAEGQKATERAMAARGYNDSGNVLLELQKDAIGQAGKYQGDAYNRQLGTSQTNYGREFDRTNQYGNLAGIGQATTNALANVGQNSANNLSNLYLQQGQGYNNAIQGGISNYLVNEQSKRNPYSPYYRPYGVA